MSWSMWNFFLLTYSPDPNYHAFSPIAKPIFRGSTKASSQMPAVLTLAFSDFRL